MAWFESNIFGFFGKSAKIYDSYKDNADKGLLERYNEIVGNDIDNEIYGKISTLYADLHSNFNMLSKFLFLKEYQIGYEYQLTNVEDILRRIHLYFAKLVQIRGSKKCIEILFQLLGYSSVIIELYDSGEGFDSSITFDTSTFDSKKACCFEYDVYLQGEIEVTDEIQQIINEIIRFNEPINGSLRNMYFSNDCISLNVPTSVSIGTDLIISATLKNTLLVPKTCTVEFDFGFLLDNGSTLLDGENIYQTENGYYESYNLLNKIDMNIVENNNNYIVLGLVADNLSALVKFEFIDNGVLVKSGLLRFMVNLDTSEIQIAEQINLFDSGTDLQNISYSADIVTDNLRLNIVAGAVGTNLVFSYKLF